MTDEEYNRKLESLQQYIPFLNNMIAQLKDPRKKNREQQLAKMVSLHSMITDKKKKLKLQTLIKCEDVILKLYDKVKAGSHSQAAVQRPGLSAGLPSPFSPITPSSPSQTRDLLKTKPVVIPTEKIPDRSERDNKMSQPSSSYKPRIDIYSSAADSLKSSAFPKASVFDRLGKRAPDMSNPPISIEDLEALQQDVFTQRMSLNELTDLRGKLQKQLEDDPRSSPINTTVRNTTILTKKAVVKTVPSEVGKVQPVEAKSLTKDTTVPKPVKVIKEVTRIFGSTFSSIDNQMLEGATKSKEKERRPSVGSKKESEPEKKDRRSSKEDKKPESASTHKSSKDKDKNKSNRKSTKHRSKDERKSSSDKTKERKDEKKSKSKEEVKKREKEKKKEEPVVKENKEQGEKPKPETKPVEPAPVYKRLADKYNPKPRKPSIEALPSPEVSKKVSESIESSMKITPAIPFLDDSQKSLTKTPPPLLQLSLTLPLLSLTSSTNSTDNEIASFNKKPPLCNPPQLVPPPTQQMQAIPTHVSNILANPNATALINSVVNQFKWRQTPLLAPAPSPYLRQPTPSPNQQNYQNFVPNEMFTTPNPPPFLQVATNFWGNQTPQRQNYPPQRSFTPLPNQFDNQMQQMDYYPPGSTPTHNTYNHQAPPLLSPQYDNYEWRQGKNEENLFGNKDRDIRCRDDWRRPSTSQRPRDSYRDPRLHRDPRGYRDDPRATPRRDSREHERDSRSKFRDPRLNRYRPERKPSRPRSRSNSRESVDNNSFVSPLDSLYSNSDNYRRTGKGYGVQNFKIPKIKKEEDLEAEPEVKVAVPEVKPKEAVPEVKQKEEEVKVVTEPEAKAGPSTEIKENVASANVSSSTECDSKLTNESQAEVAEVGEISSTNDISENQTRDEPKLSQTDIINKFLKKLLENERTRAAASLFIDNVSNLLDDDKLKMVVQTVKSASLEEEKPETRPVLKKKKLVKRRLGAKLTMTKKAVKRKLRLRRQCNVKVEDQEEEEGEEVEEGKVKEEVVVTVGERIKSRSRVAASPKRKKVKHKTELDLLHEDIQDMFIRDGVLTATGKRMCRLLKSDDTKPVLPETRPKRTRNSAENFDSKVNSDRLKVMSNVRVLINKIPVDKLTEMDDESQRYSLRRSNKSTKSYAEGDSEDEKLKEKEKEKELEKKGSSGEESEKEKEEKEKHARAPKKRRKRSTAWANGVIPKRKKKVVKEKEENEDKSFELVEPDKDYFSSKLWHSKTPCKLCDYNGMNVTKHYRNKHPDSEVLSSRLSPEKAEIAIKASLELKLDEKEDHPLWSTKRFAFRCRFCDLDMNAKPSNFYDHISTHTGEYRHLCTLCDVTSCSNKAIRLHYAKVHNRDTYNKAPWIKTRIYGYICLECNFVQMSRKTVENHVNVYHLGEGKQILKMHLSSIDDDLVRKELNKPVEKEHLEDKEEDCSYFTKVRTNLIRHLQFHFDEKGVPDIAPVNPVPCLDKSGKMFDKMTNLAISSFTGANTSRMGEVKPEQKAVKEEQTQVPAYVPANRRYVCCAEGCNYLCMEEANLRHHLHALHAHEPSFMCAHCKANLKPEVEFLLKHLKLHDLHLYKCSGCSFVHNLRHKVDEHAGDKHPDTTTSSITIRALKAGLVEVEQPLPNVGVVNEMPTTSSNIKWTKPWHCGMCKYRCAAKCDIITHIFNKHGINTQFKCTLCSYNTDDKQTFGAHFKEIHPDNEIDVIHVCYKMEGAAHVPTNQKQFDTTPLWQRDRPRVRHIRGILFEETSPQKMKKEKALPGRVSTPSTSTCSNLDLAIDAVAKGTDDCTKRFEIKETEDVIIIDDDEEIERIDESGELLIDVEGEAGPDFKAEPDFLSEETLINKYGKLCSPVAKAFRCPLCMKYKTKKISYLIHHLLTEMKCHRFKCNSCDFTSVTFDTIATHCQDKHDGAIALNVTDTPIDTTVEYWLQLLLTYQSKMIIHQSFPPSGEESASASNKSQCEFCQKWFKNVHLLKDHELYHWAARTYTCGHCCSEQATINELFQHTFMTHPTYDVSLSTNGPYVGKVLATLKCPPPVVPPPGGVPIDGTQYVCSLCPEVERSVEALRKHAVDCHEGEEFAYKVLTKAKVEVMYCCTYCHERGSDKDLRTHHYEKHEGMKFNIYQYICLECSGTFLKIKDLRGHFGKVHSRKKLSYSCVESKQSGSKDQYCCTKCPFRSCSVGGIRSHLRKHLRPIDCLLCGATFIYPTEARAHHNKEHIHNVESVEENKDRLKEYEDIVQQIVAAKEKGVKCAPPLRKMLARKSTGAPFVRKYSYYGGKKEETDLRNVSTSIEVNKVTKKITAEQFSNIFNIFPVVEVKDCESRKES